MRILFTLTTALAFSAISKLSAQPGTLDSSFGMNGAVATVNGVKNDAMIIQPDNKTVVVGTIGQLFYEDTYFVLTRYNTDGSLDSGFGTNGRVDTHFDSGFNYGTLASTLLIQPDGKIIAGGYKWNAAQPSYHVLARYQPNGSLDSTFGKKGKVIQYMPFENELYALALQNDGKIIAGGYSDGYCVVRYKSNGRLDSSFANNGILRNPDEPSASFPYALCLMPSGKIMTGDYDGFQINRLTTKGVYDSSFGTNGATLTDFYGKGGTIYSMITLLDSSFIAGGYTSNDTTSLLALAKYKKNGDLDDSFSQNGKFVIQAPYIYYEDRAKLLIQKDGKIITAGTLLFRLSSNGSMDSSFGVAGLATNFQSANDAVLQQDGKIVTMTKTSLQRFKGDEPIVSIAKNISVTEGNTAYTAAKFKIVLSHPSPSTVKVNYTTKDGTAQAGSDYVSTSGTLTIKPGKLSKMVTVNVIGDNTHESNEKFSLVLSNPVNALLGNLDSATCTIKNDDPLSPQSEVSSDAIANRATIKLFPNPVKDQLIIEGLKSGAATTSVIDMQGKILIEGSANNQKNSIDVKQLSAGVYYLRIQTGDSVTTLKFVKQS